MTTTRARQLSANAVLVARRRLTPEVDLLSVRLDAGQLAFHAGQYVTVGLELSDGWVLRPYSPANLPGSADLELLVRRVAGGRMTPRLWATEVGARLHVGPPKGLFRLLPDDRRTHLFLATGTGVAPVVAMAADLLQRRDPPAMVIVHGVRHAAELAFRERIGRWAGTGADLTYLPSASGATRDEGGVAAGRAVDLLPGAWDRLGLSPSTSVAYLCGNPAVVRAAARLLAERGVAEQAIRREEYWPPGARGSTAAAA